MVGGGAELSNKLTVTATFMYMYIYLSINLSIYIYIHIHAYTCTYIHIMLTLTLMLNSFVQPENSRRTWLLPQSAGGAGRVGLPEILRNLIRWAEVGIPRRLGLRGVVH